MHNDYAIRLQNVSKIYTLYGSQRDQLIAILGLQRIGLKPKAVSKKFAALENVSLEVPRGHRIGIIGRNGAGKTTLLKLLCGNFAPTSGSVEVNGEVQALMNAGLGFHPEYTGRENVEASFQYNALSHKEYQQAMDDVIDFCELGDYLDQPFKSYSLGMQARLMFAAATAIHPEILIVDEVLGAGDAYFVAKSKQRVDRLVNSGCTMLLVSHDMSQVLGLCKEAVWLHEGRVHMRGDVFDVVKAYEAFLHKPISLIFDSASPRIDEVPTDTTKLSTNIALVNTSDAAVKPKVIPRDIVTHRRAEIRLQEPEFLPHAQVPNFPPLPLDAHFDYIASGGVSRWNATLPGRLEFSGFSISNEYGRTNKLVALQPVQFHLLVTALEEGEYSCRYVVNISNLSGQVLFSVKSPVDKFNLAKGETRRVALVFNPLQLGPNEYIVSIALLDFGPIEKLNQTNRYDLLSRSFQFKVELPSSWAALKSEFYHSAEWYFGEGVA